MLKKVIINLIKVSVALGLITWLVNSGKLDFSLLKQLFSNPMVILAAYMVFQIDNLIVAYRLRIILHQKSTEPLSIVKMFNINWIGLFFNSVLPGSVSGDLIKLFYLKKLDEKMTKKFLLIAVFMDRVVGLMGLIFLGGLASLINYKALSGLSSDVTLLTHINIGLSGCIMLFLAILFIAPNLPYSIARLGKKLSIQLLNKLITKLEIIWSDLLLFKNKLLILIGLSMLIQTFSISIFWWITSPYAQGNFPLMTAFSIMPIGFISIAIPIAPAGLGVGHVMFEKLLGYFQVTNGASLFNLYFFVTLLSNLTGVIPYIFYSGKKKSQS